MDLNKLYYQLQEELSYIPSEKRWEHFTKRVRESVDPEQAKTLELTFTFLLETGTLPPKAREVLVVMLHGIRTHAPWHNTLKTSLEKHSETKVTPIKYGFFDAISFLFHFYHLKLRHVTQEIRMAKKDYPEHEVVIVAHSFGTYLTLKFLKKNVDFEVDRVLFCGSVVNENYNFDRLKNFPSHGSVINYIGNRDFYPVLAKSTSFGYGVSGTFGFNRHSVENVFLDSDHSGFFTPSTYEDYWIPFILNGSITHTDASLNQPPDSKILNLISIVPGFFLLLLTLFIIVIFLI